MVQGNFSIGFWLKTVQTGASGSGWADGTGLVDASAAGTDDFGLSLTGSSVSFGVGGAPDTTIASTSTVNDGGWHHIAASRNTAGVIRLYVDGSEEASTTATVNSLDDSSIISIQAVPQPCATAQSRDRRKHIKIYTCRTACAMLM
ncbi:LamG domain-containing protein [Candidatus Bathyarchaeota archaeon]|nr:LamG domain-containing protein [Candidatus Bathyarchaeota archaeon]